MTTTNAIKHISNWIKQYSLESKTKGFVIGVSGGIDSAVTSTLTAKTNLPLLCVEMPIYQKKDEIKRGKKHIQWLKKKFSNVTSTEIELTPVFEEFTKQLPSKKNKRNLLALANSRARLRMTMLYYLAQINNYIVVGTGNKIEDFGIGFFTKYGDGGVDISPIADLLKSEVYLIGEELQIKSDILYAAPTDGLWENGKTDEDQIGASYNELEWAMNLKKDKKNLTKKEKEILNIYKKLHHANLHKMKPIPVCKISERITN